MFNRATSQSRRRHYVGDAWNEYLLNPPGRANARPEISVVRFLRLQAWRELNCPGYFVSGPSDVFDVVSQAWSADSVLLFVLSLSDLKSARYTHTHAFARR